MPSKSRHKHLHQSKKKKKRRGFSVTASQQQPVSQVYTPVSQAPTPSVKVLTPKSTLPPVQYPYITIELRRIALLAGIMLIVLVVVYLVIP